MKEFFRKYVLLIILGPLVYFACEDCDDCGPSQKEPVIQIKFFNIDSLNKVNDLLIVLEDSLDTINQLIQEGDTTLEEVKTQLEESIDIYSEVQDNINDGKIKVDEVFGIDGQGPVLFRDSTTNDSLTVFKFPLDMNNDESVYRIHIAERVDELGISYQRNIFEGNHEILMNMYDIELISTTFDSVRINCNTDTCVNNATTIYLYF